MRHKLIPSLRLPQITVRGPLAPAGAVGEPDTTAAASGTTWFRLTVLALATVYVIGVSVFLLLEGSWPTPDFLIPPLVLAAVACRRGWSFVIDWTPFLVLILAYEAFRGVADDLNARVHVEELVAADRWLTNGHIPTLVLQERFYHPAELRWYDYMATFLHAAHFVVPVITGFAIWMRSRAAYWRYVVAVVGLFFAGFGAAYVYPAAHHGLPPNGEPYRRSTGCSAKRSVR